MSCDSGGWSGGWSHGRTGRKKLGGRKEKCPTFRDSARLVPKKFFRRNYFGDGGGGGVAKIISVSVPF